MRNQKWIVAVLFIVLTGVTVEAQTFTLDRNRDAGRLTLLEKGQPVFSFNYKPQLKKGVDEKYRRAGYFHPIYDLDGEPITDDFPDDHYHHRGMWLSWPWMKYQGQKMQLWHPSPLKHEFDQLVDRNLTQNKARVILRNKWVVDGTAIGREQWMVTVYRRSKNMRVMDVHITAGAIEHPIQVRGKQNANKGYGGLTVRAHPSLKGAKLLTDKGPRNNDATNVKFNWADISTNERGIAVLVHPSNPNSPQPWLLRNSYAGILNPEWPGLEKQTLKPGKPVKLKYRMIIHKGRISADRIRKYFQTGAW